MKISRGEEVLFTRVTLCNTFFSRFRGLMFHPGLDADQAYLFDRTDSIHSFNMRFVFDAVFMDRKGEILSLHPSVAPWRVIPPKKGAFWCLETAEGGIASHALEPGQRLTW
jgi:uncharacterized membrane protein (UPF0127 family)